MITLTPEQRKAMIRYLDEQIEGGVAKSLDELLRENDLPDTGEIDEESLMEIGNNFFTCFICDWTHKDEDRSSGNDQLCQACWDDR